ncbi:MAG: sodium/proline symporter, partial [Lachnospiraceae bacterium]|nr:sodium/proline symporter [Lachnospiraceae bacterium]
TTAGGFMAASTTDFIQSIVMTIAIFTVLIFATVKAGGIGAVSENIKTLPGFLSFTETFSAETGSGAPYTLLMIITTMSWGLGYFGMPHILLRFMAIKDEKKLKLSRRVASVWVVIAMGLAMLIGLVGRALSMQGTVATLEGNDTETILVKIANLLSSYGILPALLAGIALAGILACTMSTADSQLLAASSSVSQNILQEGFGIKLSEKKSMIIARLTVICVAILGVVIASDPDSSIFGVVSFAWAGFGAAFGPIVILSLYWKRTNFAGALAGMITGGAMTIIWKFLIKPMGGIWGVYELLPAFLCGLIVAVVVSLLTKAPSQEMLDEFEEVRGKGEIA